MEDRAPRVIQGRIAGALPIFGDAGADPRLERRGVAPVPHARGGLGGDLPQMPRYSGQPAIGIKPSLVEARFSLSVFHERARRHASPAGPHERGTARSDHARRRCSSIPMSRRRPPSRSRQDMRRGDQGGSRHDREGPGGSQRRLRGIPRPAATIVPQPVGAIAPRGARCARRGNRRSASAPARRRRAAIRRSGTRARERGPTRPRPPGTRRG